MKNRGFNTLIKYTVYIHVYLAVLLGFAPIILGISEQVFTAIIIFVQAVLYSKRTKQILH